MGYQVLNDFYEKEHKNTLYIKGETYPKAGFKADTDRVAYLQSDENPYKVAFLGPELVVEGQEKDAAPNEPSKPKGKSKNRSEE